MAGREHSLPRSECYLNQVRPALIAEVLYVLANVQYQKSQEHYSECGFRHPERNRGIASVFGCILKTPDATKNPQCTCFFGAHVRLRAATGARSLHFGRDERLGTPV
jgi:hypothetical protein